MYATKKIDSEHKDIIHDIAHDFYGKRMATCSSDHYVKVWDYKEDGEWHCSASFKAHSGSVWRVHWAHPEYGQVIATCSFDRTVAVWEEIVSNIGTGDKQQTHWNKRTSLVDSRTSVTDVKFAPKHLGLQLATVSADGVVRIYEAPDIMNLSQWSLVHNIICKMSCSCLSWNPSVARFHPPMLAIGSDDTSQAASVKVFIYEFNDSSRQWLKVQSIANITEPVNDIMFAPNMGRSYHLLAVASKDLRILTMKPQKKEAVGVSKYEVRQIALFDEHKPCVWRVTWNVTGTVLASAGDDGVIRLWKGNCMDNWRCVKMYSSDGSSTSSENDSPVPLLAPVGMSTPPSRYYKISTASNRNNWPGIS